MARLEDLEQIGWWRFNIQSKLPQRAPQYKTYIVKTASKSTSIKNIQSKLPQRAPLYKKYTVETASKGTSIYKIYSQNCPKGHRYIKNIVKTASKGTSPLKPISQMNWNLVGSIYGMSSMKMLISSRSVNKHGHHRQFLFLIGRYLKNLLLWNCLAKWTETW